LPHLIASPHAKDSTNERAKLSAVHAEDCRANPVLVRAIEPTHVQELARDFHPD
jgi:hypothetical protein